MTCIRLRLRYCLLKRLESFLVAEETHKPEIKIIYSNYFYVLLWLAVFIFLNGTTTCID
jgi:hypothetical protein